MLDSRGVDNLKLRVTEDGTELSLHEGVQAIARDAAGLHAAADDADAIVRFCLDRRGVWLAVAEGAGSVHVNGRRVRRMAMLRVGDAVYVDGVEMVLTRDQPIALPDDALPADLQAPPGDLRVVLRGVGGKHHGRSFTLEHPRLVGSAAEADIRIDDPAFAERHAQLSQVGAQIVLRDLGTPDGSLLNGQPVRDALLRPGDQLVFDAQHRFVVEGPGATAKPLAAGIGLEVEDETQARTRTPRARTWRRWPWLLLAALLTAGALALLLLFGAAR